MATVRLYVSFESADLDDIELDVRPSTTVGELKKLVQAEAPAGALYPASMSLHHHKDGAKLAISSAASCGIFEDALVSPPARYPL